MQQQKYKEKVYKYPLSGIMISDNVHTKAVKHCDKNGLILYKWLDRVILSELKRQK